MRTNDTSGIFILALSLLCLILIIMALPNWGQLQKSLDDPETIEEAIVRLIAQHNDEPESHLQEGQSLHNHSHEAVIDHPERSIPTDKYSTSEIIIPLNLSADTAWSTTGCNVSSTSRGLSFSNAATDSGTSDASLDFFNISNLSPTPTFYILDFSASVFKENLDIFTDIYLRDSSGNGDYFALSIYDDYIVGRTRDGTTVTTTDQFDIDLEIATLFFFRGRIVYDTAANTVFYYFNDNLLGSVSVSSDFDLSADLIIDLTRQVENSSAMEFVISELSISAGNY